MLTHMQGEHLTVAIHPLERGIVGNHPLHTFFTERKLYNGRCYLIVLPMRYKGLLAVSLHHCKTAGWGLLKKQAGSRLP